MFPADPTIYSFGVNLENPFQIIYDESSEPQSSSKNTVAPTCVELLTLMAEHCRGAGATLKKIQTSFALGALVLLQWD